MQYPLMDFLVSRHVAQSESEKVFSCRVDEEWKKRPWVGDFFKYRRTRMATIWWIVVGFLMCSLSCWTTKEISRCVLRRYIGWATRRLYGDGCDRVSYPKIHPSCSSILFCFICIHDIISCIIMTIAFGNWLTSMATFFI